MDPLSLTASIIGVATFADTVATRLWQYCKAAKNYEKEVQTLLKETKVLSTVLEGLAKMVNEEEEDITSGIPAAISACNSVLNELFTILEPFRPKPSLLSSSISTEKKSKQSGLYRSLNIDLRWSLSKSKTTELTDRLSRYKDTFALALTADQLSTVKKMLDTAELTKKELAEVKSDTTKLVKTQHSKEMKECLEWLAPVNPALKHQEFRKEYQEGTGQWIFERPEYEKWFSSTNCGLWIYAIPGAGKTILASLIIETLSETLPLGTAYYYCRHSDPASQKPHNVLGSLASQLARQHDGAYQDAYALYAKHNALRNLPTEPTERELGKLIQTQAKHFDQLNLVVDGLDEVGASISVNRSQLIEVLSELNRSPYNTRLMILSRDESDIRERLTDFDVVSVAATSTDLRLYVSAKLHLLGIDNASLRAEIFEALVDGADGMFFWTVCQIQLLTDLPNPASIRKALKSLPPGLPATYTRIFEKIDSKWPEETKKLIHRTLKWLILGQDTELSTTEEKINIDGLLHAISIEGGITRLDHNSVPKRKALHNWLGCLVRITETDTLEIAHYSVREFLLDTNSSTSRTVSRYLIRPEMQLDLAQTCFSYLALTNFDRYSFNLFDDTARHKFNTRYPFYCHAAGSVQSYLTHCPSDSKPSATTRLLTNPPPKSFFFWIAYANVDWNRQHYDAEEEPRLKKEWTELESYGDISDRITPLHVACEMHMPKTVSRLLDEGADPNAQFAKSWTPLHRLMDVGVSFPSNMDFGFNLMIDIQEVPDERINDSRKLPILRSLIKNGCDLDQIAIYRLDVRSSFDDKISPLYVAIAYEDLAMAQILVENGARVLGSMHSLHMLIEDFDTMGRGPPWRELFDIIIQRHTDSPFCELLEEAIEIVQSEEDSLSEVSSNEDCSTSEAESDENLTLTESLHNKYKETRNIDGFKAAVRAGNVDRAEYYVSAGADMNAMTDNDFRQMILQAKSENETGILSYIISKAETTGKLQLISSSMASSEEHAEAKFEILKLLLPWGLISRNERNRLFIMSCIHQDVNSMESLFEADQDFNPLSCNACEDRLTGVYLPRDVNEMKCCICWAISNQHTKILEILLGRLSKLKLIPDHCHINRAIRGRHLGILELVLQHGENPNTPDEHGIYPVHLAARITHANEGLELRQDNEVAEDSIEEEYHNARSAGLLALLQRHGADLSKTSQGRNALHFAMNAGVLGNVKYLASHHVDPHSADAGGGRPIHAACESGFEDGIDFVLRHPEISRSLDAVAHYVGTPLSCAAIRGYVKIVEKLLDAGANINLQALPGNPLGPALYAACAYGRSEVVELLLSRGANLNAQGARYHSAIAVAEAFEQKDVAELLRKHIAS